MNNPAQLALRDQIQAANAQAAKLVAEHNAEIASDHSVVAWPMMWPGHAGKICHKVISQMWDSIWSCAELGHPNQCPHLGAGVQVAWWSSENPGAWHCEECYLKIKQALQEYDRHKTPMRECAYCGVKLSHPVMFERKALRVHIPAMGIHQDDSPYRLSPPLVVEIHLCDWCIDDNSGGRIRQQIEHPAHIPFNL